MIFAAVHVQLARLLPYLFWKFKFYFALFATQSVQSRRLRAWQAFLEFPEAPKIFSGAQILAGF